MSKVMEKVGLPYHQATNGQEAVDLYRLTCHSVQCIFIGTQSRSELGISLKLTDPKFADLSLPVMDGHTAIRHIREFEYQNGLPHTRIVAMTVLERASLKGLDSGADLMICKPFSIQQMVELASINGPLVGASPNPRANNQAPIRRLQMVKGHFRGSD